MTAGTASPLQGCTGTGGPTALGADSASGAGATASAAAVIAEKDKLMAIASEKEAECKAKEEAETQAKQKVASDASAEKDAEAALKDALAKQASGDAALLLAESQKTELELMQKHHIAPLLEGTAEDSKLSAKEVMKVAKKFISEPSLLESLPTTLAKAKDSRGTFDGLVIKQMEESFATALGDVTTVVSKGAATKEELAAAVAAATQAKYTAQEILQASEKAIAEVKTAVKAASDEVKLAKNAAKKAEHDSRLAEKASSAAATSLADFKEHAMGAFERLKERAPPPPSPVEPEPEEKAAPAALPAAELVAPTEGA